MTRHASLLVACVATLLVLLAVSASAAVPRCAEDGFRAQASAFPAVLSGALSYNGVKGCAGGATASFEIVDRKGSMSTIAMLSNWKYIVALRNAEPAVYTLKAKCNGEVVCEEQVTYVATAD